MYLSLKAKPGSLKKKMKYSSRFVSFQVINTSLKLKPGASPPPLEERFRSETAAQLGITLNARKKKPKQDRRIADMQNQWSMYISLDDANQATISPNTITSTEDTTSTVTKNPHVMFFTNYSLTITGIRSKSQARKAIRKLLVLFPELERATPLTSATTTMHYSIGYPLDPFTTAKRLQQLLPKEYVVMYRGDIAKYIRIIYHHEQADANTFIIQKSGKIMQSCSNYSERKTHFNIITQALEEQR